MTARSLLGFQLCALLVTALVVSVAREASAGGASAEDPPTWVELGDNGTIIARQILTVSDKGVAPPCPTIKIVGATPAAMTQRKNPAPQLFPVVVCEAVIPNGATSASIGSIQLPLPKAKISKIALVGDTGCKGDATGKHLGVTSFQDPEEEPQGKQATAEENCADPSVWPFSTIATRAAERKPDLVIHVGDYVYVKEKEWLHWQSQFFTPARDLLLAAPWIFVRGNHETCGGGHGQGFFYLLDPRLNASCSPDDNEHQVSQPYLVRSGGSRFLVMDSAAAECDVMPKASGSSDGKSCALDEYDREVAAWTGLFGKAKQLLGSDSAFLLTHRPLWGIKPIKLPSDQPPAPDFCRDATHALVAINSALQRAYQAAAMTGITRVLSGHIHNFQLATYEGDPVPQLVIGDSGVKLSTSPPHDRKHCKVPAATGDLTLSTFRGKQDFGFGELSSDGIQFVLHEKNGDSKLKCAIADHVAHCSP